jgi:hypothetical protein
MQVMVMLDGGEDFIPDEGRVLAGVVEPVICCVLLIIELEPEFDDRSICFTAVYVISPTNITNMLYIFLHKCGYCGLFKIQEQKSRLFETETKPNI